MAKSLVDKLKSGFRSIRRNFKNIILSATAGLFLYGAQCVPNPPPTPPDPENNPPTANLYVSPNYGQAPLLVSIKLDGDDKNGIEDIVEYITGIDKNENKEIDNDEIIKIDSYPINEEIIFNTAGTYKILGQVTDSHGATDKKSLSVVVSSPYVPTVDLSLIPESEKNFNEESQTIINLPSPYDPNPEDEPVWYVSATPKDVNMNGIPEVNVISLQKNQLTNKYELTLRGNLNETGIYQVELELKNIKEEIGKAILQGEIYNLADISGRLEDTKTNLGAPGTIEAYNLEETILSGETQTDSQGNFEFQLNQRVSEFILKGKITDYRDSFYRKILFASQDRDGFSRIPFSGEDKSGIIIRAMPYDTLRANNITKEQFGDHIRKTNTGNWNPEPGLMKWDLNILEGIEILNYNPLNPTTTFSSNDQNFIGNKVKDPNDIEIYVEGKIHFKETPLNENDRKLQIDTQENQESQKHYWTSGNYVIPDVGWIVVVPDNVNATRVYDGYDRIIDSVRIELIPGINSDYIDSHEFAHAFISPEDLNENGIPSPLWNYTIISAFYPYGIPGIVDKEQAYVVNEETNKGREYKNNMLGF